MSRYLKLTNFIINKKYIHHIDIKNKDKFIIHLMTNNIDGFFLFTSGTFDSHNSEFVVCKTQHLSDYKIVSDWIDNDLK